MVLHVVLMPDISPGRRDGSCWRWQSRQIATPTVRLVSLTLLLRLGAVPMLGRVRSCAFDATDQIVVRRNVLRGFGSFVSYARNQHKQLRPPPADRSASSLSLTSSVAEAERRGFI